MDQQELRQYQQDQPEAPFWMFQGLAFKGESLMALGGEHGWTPVPLWGKAGHDLGEWPFEIVLLKDQTIEGPFDITFHVTGCTNLVYSAPSKEIRNQIVDAIAFSLWKLDDKPWVEGIETIDQLSGEHTGPFSERWAS